ncbi:hypothetical protein WA026_020462 [Henosepilachna vigintioctopunctata]|uniref:Uncharacterized protein n=1 Tax=Henosepilachna vigintioctopunctata TaxID=420089 RepID=A0AAW1VHU4_9CUCU
MFHVNVQCLSNKLEMIELFLSEFNFDIICFSEHWQTEANLKSINIDRGFSLHEALAMLEEYDVNTKSITLLPPNNGCGNITDEDSGVEDQLDIKSWSSTLKLF